MSRISKSLILLQEEENFWKELLQRYLYPLPNNKESQEKMHDELRSLRNKVSGMKKTENIYIKGWGIYLMLCVFFFTDHILLFLPECFVAGVDLCLPSIWSLQNLSKNCGSQLRGNRRSHRDWSCRSHVHSGICLVSFAAVCWDVLPQVTTNTWSLQDSKIEKIKLYLKCDALCFSRVNTLIHYIAFLGTEGENKTLNVKVRRNLWNYALIINFYHTWQFLTTLIGNVYLHKRLVLFLAYVFRISSWVVFLHFHCAIVVQCLAHYANQTLFFRFKVQWFPFVQKLRKNNSRI